jgi:glycerophosphoryl diester phosphodiesterase
LSGKIDTRASFVYCDARFCTFELALDWRMPQLSPLELPRVIGHRGAAAYAPENTLESFREARRRGASWIETDVKLTADGVPILMHDESLKRTTGVDRLVAETPAVDLPSDVPTFEAAIACWRELGLGANVEIKPCPGREVETARVAVETLRRCWPSELPAPLLSSFKRASLAAAKDAAPEFARALLFGEIDRNWRARAEEVGAVGVNTDGSKLTAPQAVAIRAAGYLLGVYTVNDGAVARALVGMGAQCVISDAPDVIVAALG